uniref:MAM domain-containing protein n=1 Tax=Arion vulgaris TaxID=1028688 RepID=A0A0B7AY17_9EUPU
MVGTVYLLTIVAMILQTLSVSDGKRSCTFKHDGCTYKINLNHHHKGSTGTEQEHSDCGNKEHQVFLDRAQNDYNAKIDDMEKSVSFLRDSHEQRLKELEFSVRELLGIDKVPVEKGDKTVDITKTLPPNFFNNEALVNRLQEEFNKLRDEIKQKSSELMDAELKLNETGSMMHEAQLQHFKTSQELLNAENEITVLRRERAVLKNQLKDRIYKLDVSTSMATECETKSADQQDTIAQLFRSENILKEELMTVELKFNKSKVEMQLLEKNHTDLKAQHKSMMNILKIRERELISCYSTKTNTFCGFEDPHLCGFTNINDTSDFFDWERAKGSTPSGGTGPTKDHTCDGPTGHFMFIEASAKGRGSNAILYSPLYRGMSEQCVEFFYHMNGRHIGTLNVYAQARGDVLQSAWRAYGNQGNVWTNARLAIPKILANVGYQIAFEGITENGYQGDISIDDVSVIDGPCPIDEKIVPVHVAVQNSTSIAKQVKEFTRKVNKAKKRNGR